MLNISYERIGRNIDLEKYGSFKQLGEKKHSNRMIYVITILVIAGILVLFLPWTQNIRAKGYVTTLEPDKKPQSVQALIGGKIEKWYVTEGQVVSVGDTIMKISEVKEEYLDPEILPNTENQINAKKGSAIAYTDKMKNLTDQVNALEEGRKVKLQQNELKINQVLLKIAADSIELEATKIQFEIAERQLNRAQNLYNDGIKPLTDVEDKNLKYQEMQAKVVALTNKLESLRNELGTARADRQAIENDYQDKLAKARSEINTAASNKFEAEATVNKLQSQYNSYEIRQRNYYITSPVEGVIMETLQSGIGEIVKNGDKVVNIIPKDFSLAIEMFVTPEDITLLTLGQRVMIQFDGWPAIVFSGWPNNSYGTFGGKISAIDNFISSNGKYRVLVSPSDDEIDWPEQIRLGSGANTITLLQNVSVAYELWRKLNGFPPDYYINDKPEEVKTKAPLRSVK